MNTIKLLLTSLLIFLITSPAASQLLNDRFQFDPELPYQSGITSPAEFLGYQLGEEYSHNYQLGAYLKNLASESDRVSVITYGQTYEGRDLWLVIITGEENHDNLEQIRENNLRLADFEDLSRSEVAELAEDHPAIVWLSYGVHGNEASS
ncbi:MAG: M14 family zinc carboxypeptidase, partial [Bacteroidales bacterium]